jgi:hypothetical protein
MITASAIPASREQTSPAPPRLLDVLQQGVVERRDYVEIIRAYMDWTMRFILFHGKRWQAQGIVGQAQGTVAVILVS